MKHTAKLNPNWATPTEVNGKQGRTDAFLNWRTACVPYMRKKRDTFSKPYYQIYNWFLFIKPYIKIPLLLNEMFLKLSEIWITWHVQSTVLFLENKQSVKNTEGQVMAFKSLYGIERKKSHWDFREKKASLPLKWKRIIQLTEKLKKVPVSTRDTIFVRCNLKQNNLRAFRNSLSYKNGQIKKLLRRGSNSDDLKCYFHSNDQIVIGNLLAGNSAD